MRKLLLAMGRREQRRRERKRAAASCRSLTQFMPPEKKSGASEDSSPHGLPERELEREPEPAVTDTREAEDFSGESPLNVDKSDKSPSEISVSPICSPNPVRVVCPSSNLHAAATPTDVGSLFLKQKSPHDFRSVMNELSDVHKYTLLKNHKVPEKNHIFPTQYLGGCNRSFRHVWLSQHPWMVYSEEVDGAFCIYCTIFCSDSSKGAFVNKPFRVWNKKSEKVREHENSLYHQRALEQADNFRRSVEQLQSIISAQKYKAES